jgi:hypothetical protein
MAGVVVASLVVVLAVLLGSSDAAKTNSTERCRSADEEATKPGALGLDLATTACWTPGKPPHLKHGRFRSRPFMMNYPLPNTFFSSLEAPASFDTLRPVLRKLSASREIVEVVLIGG